MPIFEINLFGIHIAPSYYGLMYAIGFFVGYYYILKKNIITKVQLENLFLYIFAGVILGGRIGYIFFYDFHYYLGNPANIIKVWEGGMSFHGGLLGVIISVLLFCRLNKISFLKLIDELAVIIPVGLGFGRIGNYLNKELLGFSPYNGPLAVVKNGIGYFPSTLVEFILEGVILFIILFSFNKYKKFNGQIGCLFLMFYSSFRIIVEIFFRTPDVQIGYIFSVLTMGMILSIPMFLSGLIIYLYLSPHPCPLLGRRGRKNI